MSGSVYFSASFLGLCLLPPSFRLCPTQTMTHLSHKASSVYLLKVQNLRLPPPNLLNQNLILAGSHVCIVKV